MLSKDSLTQFLQNVKELPFAKTEWCCFLLQSLRRCADISIHQPCDEDEQAQVEADGFEAMEESVVMQEAMDPDDMALLISPLPLPSIKESLNGIAECGEQQENYRVCCVVVAFILCIDFFELF